MNETREYLLKCLDETENDIDILLERIRCVRKAEALLGDEAFEKWLEKFDFEEDLMHIQLI